MPDPQLTDAQLLALCRQAGVTPSEIEMHPEHGVFVSLSGLAKLGMLSPSGLSRGRLIEALAEIAKQDGEG